MNRLMKRLMGVVFAAAFVAGAPCTFASTPVTVLTNLTVTKDAMPTLPGWSIGGSGLSVAPATPPPVSGDAPYALEAKYPAVGSNGEAGPWANFDVSSLNTRSIYIDFWAKMPDSKQGLKFCKVFGKRNDPVGYANSTFGPAFMGVPGGSIHGAIFAVAFGDGTNIDNDTQNMIRMAGNDRSQIGRSYGKATVLTPQMSEWPSSNWGSGWHHFRFHIKFNSGTTAANEVPDGEVYLEIDGKVYVDATGLYNRNPGNGPIQYIGFFGWAQTDPQPFDIWYDNIVISTGGFASSAQPDPMSTSAK